MKKFITITLFTIIIILLTDFSYNSVKMGEVLSYINITLKQLVTIAIFIAIIYFIIKFSNKGKVISYFLPVLIWYVIDETLLKLEVFSSVIVTIPSSVFLVFVVIVIVMYYLRKIILENK